MRKEATKEISVGNLIFKFFISRSIYFDKGDGWETSDKTHYIEETKISVIDQNGVERVGSFLSILQGRFKSEIEMMKKGCYACIPGINLGLRRDSYDILKKAFDETSEEAMFAEWQEYLLQKDEKEKSVKMEAAKETIELAEKEIAVAGNLMTLKELKEWMVNYNNIMNEGGSGFIPRRISLEEYEEAKKYLNASLVK